MAKNKDLEAFSDYLFWDTDRTKLGVKKSKTYIIERVLF